MKRKKKDKPITQSEARSFRQLAETWMNESTALERRNQSLQDHIAALKNMEKGIEGCMGALYAKVEEIGRRFDQLLMRQAELSHFYPTPLEAERQIARVKAFSGENGGGEIRTRG